MATQMEYQSDEQESQVKFLLACRGFDNLRRIIHANVVEADGTALIMLEYELNGMNRAAGQIFHYHETVAVKANGDTLQLQTCNVTIYPDIRYDRISPVTHTDGVWEEMD